jgi:prephenate dehydrogenase
MNTVAVVGVGLIGGSFALALRKAGFDGSIIGVSSQATIDAAIRVGAIDEGRPLRAAAAASDLVYLAQPIGGILRTLAEIDAVVRPGTLVTDAGSTKVAIMEAARGLRRAQFLGGHPLAGKEQRGVGSAEAELFRDRVYVLCGDCSTAAARDFVTWLKRIGALPVELTPEEHDRVVAFTSHLPQLISTALAIAIHRHVAAEYSGISGPGLVDSTRLALSSFEVWRDIFATNQSSVAAAVDAFMTILGELRADAGSLENAFAEGSEAAARIRATKAVP